MAKKHERDHLYQKAGESTWYVRLVVPADVRPAFGNRSTLTKTTRTSNKTEAMVARLPILALWKQQIHEARHWKSETGDEWRQQAADVGVRLNTTRALAAQKMYSPSGDQSEPADLSWLESLPEIASDLVSDGRADLANRLAKYAERFVDGMGRKMSPEEGISLANEFAVLISEVSIAATADDYELTPKELADVQAIVLDPKAYKPRSPITRAMLTRWREHLNDQLKTEKTRDMHRNRVQRFSDYLSEEGASLTFDTVHSFLSTLPPARQTRADYLWSFRTFWKWANKYEKDFRSLFSDKQSPFDGHELPKTGKDAGQHWIPFTREEVEFLHSEAVKKGDADLARLIQFGAYTGARLEELGRIATATTIFEDGVPVGFKITEAKTDAGVREVPIHPSLVALYEELLTTASARDGYLFAGGNNKYGNRFDALSKRFGRLKKKNFTDLHVFHSVRKTFISQMHKAGIRIEVLPYIVGHETGALTLDIYSSGPSFKQKAEAIGLLSYDFTK